jgi:hypothetical protein
MTAPNLPDPQSPWPYGPPPAQPWIGNGPPARGPSNFWNAVGWTVGIALVVIGLFAVAAFVLIIVGLNNMGNNK